MQQEERYCVLFEQRASLCVGKQNGISYILLIRDSLRDMGVFIFDSHFRLN